MSASATCSNLAAAAANASGDVSAHGGRGGRGDGSAHGGRGASLAPQPTPDVTTILVTSPILSHPSPELVLKVIQSLALAKVTQPTHLSGDPVCHGVPRHPCVKWCITVNRWGPVLATVLLPC